MDDNTHGRLARKSERSCALGAVLLFQVGYVQLLIPKPQYSFLYLLSEIVGPVNESPFAIVHPKQQLWHLNESLLAFRLNDLYNFRRMGAGSPLTVLFKEIATSGSSNRCVAD